MDSKLNILILSAGTRNKIVQYFKEELNDKGLVIATDSSRLAPAIYEADKHYVVPRIDHPNYIETILEICKDNQVNAVFSLIDPELSLLAEHKQDFLDNDVVPIISNYEAIELAFNKYKMSKFLNENSIESIKSYISLEEFYKDLSNEEIDFPVFVKPYNGSASININIVNNMEELELLFSEHDNLMIQELMTGIEYGADVYIDLISKEVTSIFLKEKIAMRAGETDKSRSVVNDEAFDLIKKVVDVVGFVGVIDIDIFQKNGNFIISEVNPRFGGGYPHGHECGVNIPKQIVNNLKNVINQDIVGNYKEDTYMMKYNEVLIKENL